MELRKQKAIFWPSLHSFHDYDFELSLWTYEEELHKNIA